MSALLLSNWFPIRARDSDDVRSTPPPPPILTRPGYPCLFTYSSTILPAPAIRAALPPRVALLELAAVYFTSSFFKPRVSLSLPSFRGPRLLRRRNDLVPCAGRLRAIDFLRPG